MNPPRKRALVTGGSGEIGAAICRQLAATGLHVYIHAHTNLSAASALARELNAAGLKADGVAFDVTDAEQVRDRLGILLAEGAIQIVINNAGIHDDAVFPGMTHRQWHRVMDVSVDGFFNVTQPLMMPMIRTRWGRVVNISSVSALIGNRGQVNYSAAKGALNAATRSLALEVASRGITVNAVAPGVIRTTQTLESFDADIIERLVPMKRAGRPEEVASLVGYLVSDEAAYITGQIISVNGGII
ncbi:MAG: 3-oxoacyl-ACP reductase FabG [Steroidobacterales bacterium]